MEDHKRTHFNPIEDSTSSTLRTPIVRIEDHKSEVLSCDFHPSGKFLLSSNRNGQILGCDIYGTCSKSTVLEGHRGAVMEACFSADGLNIYSCSTDKELGIWDSFRGFRKARLRGHTAGINSVRGARTPYPILCSGSNDGTIRIWDVREKNCVVILHNLYSITATCFSADTEHIISGGSDNDIKIWDIRMCAAVCKLVGHKSKVTGISLSPCGSYLLSNSVDNTLRVWDISPHFAKERCITIFPSYQHSTDGLLRCTWSPDGTMISAGTSDRDVYVLDSLTGKTLYNLPGHESGINDVTFHPYEKVILSASKDNYVFLHEMKEI